MPADTDQLTAEEQAYCLFFTGYSGLQTVAGLTGAWPAAFETSYIITSALQNLKPGFLPIVRATLGRLRTIDETLGSDAIERLAVSRMGDMVMRGTDKGQSETDRLWVERERWVKILCDTLGVAPYQYRQNASDGINVRVE